MSHIVDSCPLLKLNGSLSQLHSADDEAAAWLISCCSQCTARRRRNVQTRQNGLRSCLVWSLLEHRIRHRVPISLTDSMWPLPNYFSTFLSLCIHAVFIDVRIIHLIVVCRLLGIDRLVAFALAEWLQDIKKNQLPSLLGGVGPLYSLVQLGWSILVPV